MGFRPGRRTAVGGCDLVDWLQDRPRARYHRADWHRAALGLHDLQRPGRLGGVRHRRLAGLDLDEFLFHSDALAITLEPSQIVPSSIDSESLGILRSVIASSPEDRA